MSNYYTRFSIVLPLPDEAAQKYAVELAAKVGRIRNDEEKPADFPTSLLEEIEDWQFETHASSPDGKWGIWMDSENGGVDAVCAFIQHLLQKFDPKRQVTFEWSHDCNKPLVDAYGGGAAVITAKKIKTMNTANWLRKNAA